MRCFERCISIFNDAIFHRCFKKLQNIVQTMHLTMSIAHPYLLDTSREEFSSSHSSPTSTSTSNYSTRRAGFLASGYSCDACVRRRYAAAQRRRGFVRYLHSNATVTTKYWLALLFLVYNYLEYSFYRVCVCVRKKITIPTPNPGTQRPK